MKENGKEPTKKEEAKEIKEEISNTEEVVETKVVKPQDDKEPEKETKEEQASKKEESKEDEEEEVLDPEVYLQKSMVNAAVGAVHGIGFTDAKRERIAKDVAFLRTFKLKGVKHVYEEWKKDKETVGEMTVPQKVQIYLTKACVDALGGIQDA